MYLHTGEAAERNRFYSTRAGRYLSWIPAPESPCIPIVVAATKPNKWTEISSPPGNSQGKGV